jgi:hypothetical protein
VDLHTIPSQAGGVYYSPDQDTLIQCFADVGRPSAEGYRVVLEPRGPEAPRCLLPARTGIALHGTPPYRDLYATHAGRETSTAAGLNARLRTLAERITCELPIDRTDTMTLAACKVP